MVASLRPLGLLQTPISSTKAEGICLMQKSQSTQTHPPAVITPEESVKAHWAHFTELLRRLPQMSGYRGYELVRLDNSSMSLQTAHSTSMEIHSRPMADLHSSKENDDVE